MANFLIVTTTKGFLFLYNSQSFYWLYFVYRQYRHQQRLLLYKQIVINCIKYIREKQTKKVLFCFCYTGNG